MATILYPYPVLSGEPNLTVTKLLVDGNKPAVPPMNTESHVIDLHGLNRDGWSYVTIHVRIEADSEEVRGLEAQGTDLRATLVAYGREAEMRQTTPLVQAERNSAIWTGSFDLDRLNLRGKVSIRGIVTGNVDGVEHRFLAQTPTWTVWVDEPPTSIVEGTLNVEWRDFTKDEDRPQVIPATYSREIFFTDLVSSVPTIYLNKGLNGLTQLLAKPPADPGQRALHDSQMTGIASQVWLSMFNASAAAVEDPDDGEPVPPASDWQERVLKVLLPHIYDCGPDEALAKLVEDLQTPEGANDLASRVQAAIAVHIKSSRRLLRSIKALDVLEAKGGEDG